MRDNNKLEQEIRKSDSDKWDEQIEKDMNCGKFDILVKEALSDYKIGKTKEL